MRFFLVISILLLISTSAWALAPDDSALIGVWLFNEGSGTSVGDMSGNGNDGTIKGDIGWDNNGKFGAAMLAKGGGSIDVGDSDSINTIADGFTVAAWFRVDADSDTGVRKNGSFLLEDQSTSEPVPDGFSFRVWTDKGITPGLYGQTELKQGQWYHIAGTYDGKMVEMYIDGEPESAKGVLADNKSDWTPEWEGKVGAGSMLQLKFGSESYTGAIDEIVLFGRALSGDEVKELGNGWENLGKATAVEAQGKLATTWATLKSTR
jgi:hypothetical protein